jgi:hypothetical protein
VPKLRQCLQTLVEALNGNAGDAATIAMIDGKRAELEKLLKDIEEAQRKPPATSEALKRMEAQTATVVQQYDQLMERRHQAAQAAASAAVAQQQQQETGTGSRVSSLTGGGGGCSAVLSGQNPGPLQQQQQQTQRETQQQLGAQRPAPVLQPVVGVPRAVPKPTVAAAQAQQPPREPQPQHPQRPMQQIQQHLPKRSHEAASLNDPILSMLRRAPRRSNTPALDTANRATSL